MTQPSATPNGVSRRALLRGATAAGAVLAMGKVAGCTDDDSPDAAPPPPNIIVVMADDMRFDELPFMPNVDRLLVNEGVSFTGARHNISLCSPARAGFLTGQYSFRHGVRSQSDGFSRSNDDQKTIAVWLQAAGYETALIGKYFTGGNRTTPGWSTRRQLSANAQSQHGYTVWDGTDEVSPTVDQSTYLNDEVVRFLERAREPFFLWFTPTANHWPLDAPPGHEDDAATLEWPDDREDDVTDKPPWIQALPPLDETRLGVARAQQQGRVRELLGLDDTIGAIVETLGDAGRLDGTTIMFSSDNGVFAGEHRIPLLSKNLPYEPSVRVPCILRSAGLERGVVASPAHMAIDLTATCIHLSGAKPDLAPDGVSLVDLARDPAAHEGRRLLYDRDDRDDDPALLCPPAAGVFTATRKLVRYETDPPTYELYDLEADPDELVNLASDPRYASERDDLEIDLDRLLAD